MAMDLWSYLLSKVAEEAAEIAQAACKVSNYGPHDHDPRDATPRHNLDKLIDEVNDLHGVLELLRDCVPYHHQLPPAARDQVYQSFGRIMDSAAIQAKKDRVAQWAERSVQTGMLDPEAFAHLQYLLTPTPRHWFNRDA